MSNGQVSPKRYRTLLKFNALNTQSNLIYCPGQFQVPKTRFWDNLGAIWEQSRYTDVTLVVRGQEIKAHKNILAAHSAVFNAMFENDMREKQVLNPGLGQWSFVLTPFFYKNTFFSAQAGCSYFFGDLSLRCSYQRS